MKSISDLTLISLPTHNNATGSLTVVENQKQVPFDIARVFFVRALKGEVRGNHAHKRCRQFLLCTSGTVEVICKDGTKEVIYTLDAFDKGLLIPESIWAHQVYKSDDAVLTVFCDRLYEEHDYLRDYTEFLTFRGVH